MFDTMDSLNSGQNTQEIVSLIKFVHTTKLLTQKPDLVRLNRFLASVSTQKLTVIRKRKNDDTIISQNWDYILGETQNLDQQCKEMTGKEGYAFIELQVR